MKSKHLILLCLYTLMACGQQNTQETRIKDQDTTTMITTKKQTELNVLQIPIENITADNLVETIANQVLRYEKEPIYYLRIGKANCLIEVLVNDVPVYEDFSLDNLATPLEINHNILKSGIQTVMVRMYPVGDLIKEEYDYGETVTTLSDASAVHITVLHADHKGNEGIDDEETVMTYHSPTKDETGEVFVGSGVPFFEYTFTFEAIVPYHIENSWDTAVDLTKLDPKYVEQEAINFYQSFVAQYTSGNKDFIAKLIYSQLLDEAQTYYKTKEEIQETWEEDLELLTNKTLKSQLLDKNYEAIYYAHGGGVFLRHKSPKNPQLERESIAWVTYEKEYKNKGRFFPLYLYCPKKMYRGKKLVFQMM